MNKIFSDDAWADYLFWQGQDKRTLKRINQLLKEIERDPFSGIGKPEALRGNLSGLWSRRIDQKNRIIYSVDDDRLLIYSCRDHYE
jgi:toxin YoeB